MLISIIKTVKNVSKRLFVAVSLLFVIGHMVASQQPGGLATARQKAEAAKQQRELAAKAPSAPRAAPRRAVSRDLSAGQALPKPVEPVAPRPIEVPAPPAPPALQPTIVSVVQPVTPIATTQKKEDTDAYVQSEAHMQLSDVKLRMSNFNQNPEGVFETKGKKRTPNQMVTPYLNVVAGVLNKEVEFKDSHYVFYHGHTNAWLVAQDLYKRLYAYYKPLQPVKDFVFVRFTDMKSTNATDYLKESVATWAGVNDNIQDVRTVMIPANLALFGNVGFPGECTWNYFLEAKSHRMPLGNNYQEIQNTFGLSYDLDTLTKEANELAEMLNQTDEQTLLQIFVPQEKVDEIAYLSWVLGFPAHPKSIERAEEVIQARMLSGAPRAGSITGPAVKSLMKKYQYEGTDNPDYKDLIEAVDRGDFGVKSYLEVYRNRPWELKNPNEVQARLLITPEVIQNPNSGAKFFRYTTTSRKVKKVYFKKIDALVKKVIAQEESKTAEQKTKDKAKNAKRLEQILAELKAGKK